MRKKRIFYKCISNSKCFGIKNTYECCFNCPLYKAGSSCGLNSEGKQHTPCPLCDTVLSRYYKGKYSKSSKMKKNIEDALLQRTLEEL